MSWDDTGLRHVGLAQLLALYATNNQESRRLFLDEDEDDEDIDDPYHTGATWHDDQAGIRRPTAETGRSNWFPPVLQPNPAGEELLMSGDFGRVGPKLRKHPWQRNLARMVFDRPAMPTSLTREHMLNVSCVLV